MPKQILSSFLFFFTLIIYSIYGYVPLQFRFLASGRMNMMAGPNQNQNPAFFKDPNILKNEIQFYLSEREMGKSKMMKVGSRNPFLEFFSVDPKKFLKTSNDGSDIEQWEGIPDALEYSELSSYGYGYLIEPIMDAGGYVAVSNALNIPLNAQKRRIEKPTVKIGRPQPSDGFLTLGSALNERLDSTDSIIEQKDKNLFDRQSRLDVQEREDDRYEYPIYTRTPQIPQPELTPLVISKIPSEKFMLNLTQRFYSIVLALSVSLGYGAGTPSAVAYGLPENLVEFFRVFGSILLIANATCTAYSLYMATQKNRSVLIWTVKGFIAGPASAVELQNLKNL